jgi:hypothetical protein
MMDNFIWQSCEAGLLNKSSCLAPALGVTKITNAAAMFLSLYVVLLRSHLDVEQTLF